MSNKTLHPKVSKLNISEQQHGKFVLLVLIDILFPPTSMGISLVFLTLGASESSGMGFRLRLSILGMALETWKCKHRKF
jgi:hypothetical protein